jgi:hypothetical protein
MPETITYDPQTKALHIGDGVVGPIDKAVWDYEISGMKVVKRWFDRRKRDPDGRRSSPLEDIVPTSWDADWTSELLEMLNVLAMLVELEPTQAALLERIVTSPQITVSDLTTAGVLPVTSRATVEQPRRTHGTLFDEEG